MSLLQRTLGGLSGPLVRLQAIASMSLTAGPLHMESERLNPI